jgi:hypothetical protein
MPLPGNAALKLSTYFLARSLFQGIGASAVDNSDCNRDQNRVGFHPLILGSSLLFASGVAALVSSAESK